MIKELCRLNNIGISYQRIFQVFGDGENENRFWPSLRRAAINGEDFHMSKGNQIRDFIDVKIAGEIIAKIALENKIGAFNVCSGIPKSVKELVNEVAKDFKRPDILNFGARADNLTDFPKILGVPNFD